MFEKLNSFKTDEKGVISTPYILDKEGKPKTFINKTTYESYKKNRLDELNQEIKFKLNPQEFWLTQASGKKLYYFEGIERPFTGKYWDFNKVGVYCCKVCTQRLFRYLTL